MSDSDLRGDFLDAAYGTVEARLGPDESVARAMLAGLKRDHKKALEAGEKLAEEIRLLINGDDEPLPAGGAKVLAFHRRDEP